MGVGEDEIKYIRDNFEKKYAGNIASDAYDDRDLRRLHTDDVFVTTFFRGPGRLDEGVDLVHECFRFRKEYEVNDITEGIFEQWLWEKQGLFFHNRTKSGHKILFLRVKLHKKDTSQLPMVKKFFIYWLEMSFKVQPLEKIVTLFDMTEAGLSNLDMDFIRFILTSFKLYYPTLLEKLLIYEMPWIFNAAWKIIKTWLSAEAVSKIKFVTKSDVHTYIDREQLFPHMGGTASWETVDFRPSQTIDTFNDADDSADSKSKRVTFTDSCESVSSNHSPTNNVNNNASNRTVTSPRATRNNSSAYDGGGSFTGRLLTISPADQLTFVAELGGREVYDVITLTNTLVYPIAFKVKTTAPEKYRVRPSTGVVKPGEAFEVYVYLQPGYINTVDKDKFLVMAMEVTGDTYDTNLWKTAAKDTIMEHRMRCAASGNVDFNVNVATAGPGKPQPPQTMASKPPSNPAPPPAYSGGYASRVKGFFLGPSEPLKSSLSPMDQLIESNKQLRRRMGWLIVSHIVFFILTLLFFGAFFCLGEDLFSSYLYFPFGYCVSSSWSRRC